MRKKLQKYNPGDTHMYCPGCDTTKPLDDFQKSKARQSGKQLYCKVCQNKKTLEYRVRTEGAYWKHKENDPYFVYQIKNPIGEVYIGYTSTKPNLRWRRHVAQFNFGFSELKKLHQSFQTHGVDHHTFEVIENCNSKVEAKNKETYHILKAREKGISLNTLVSGYRVGQYDKKTKELIREWDNIQDAADFLGKPSHTIYSTLKLKNRHGVANGYFWKVLPFSNGMIYDPKEQRFVN